MAAARRGSILSSSDNSGGGQVIPSLTGGAHRRMSRFDANSFQGAVRRMSMAFRRSSVSHSQITSQLHPPAVKLQNTYRTEPNENEKFNASRVSSVIESVLSNYLENEEYEYAKCNKLSETISEILKNRVKDLHYPRYRLISHVIIGQNTGQNIALYSRCLAFEGHDTYATATYKKGSLYACGCVYGIYKE